MVIYKYFAEHKCLFWTRRKLACRTLAWCRMVQAARSLGDDVGLDQTRGWFYTLMVLSTALFGKPAFRNLVCNGLVLAADGKKMSKRLKNYPVRDCLCSRSRRQSARYWRIHD